LKNKLSKKAQHNFRLTVWITLGISLIAFGAILVLLQGTIKHINQDPALANLTNDTVFKVVQIINTNKNLNSDNLDKCWNQKNPNITCSEANKIESGTYTIHGGKDAFWLEGPQTNLFNKDLFALEDDYIREILGGFMLADQTYFQKIIISYPDSPDTMDITIETQNLDKYSYSQFLTLSK